MDCVAAVLRTGSFTAGVVVDECLVMRLCQSSSNVLAFEDYETLTKTLCSEGVFGVDSKGDVVCCTPSSTSFPWTICSSVLAVAINNNLNNDLNNNLMK